ncbi:hypothetical protein [Flaviaesturariibacter amylovorans]|uniref:T9SS type A sorting domain-containing protein n=1 Tax=Flaviaesturariibacter amylovorans TaxID=1084520 RepID=A0ABP8HRS7_9BACT
MKQHLLFLLLVLCLGTASLAQPGRVDHSFTPATGELGTIYRVLTQADGKLLVYGARYSSAGSTVLRYHPDGTRDSSFRASGFSNDGPYSPDIALQPDGKILLLTVYNGQPAILRLLTDGSTDPSFQYLPDNDDTYLSAILPLPGGGVLAGGRFPDGNGNYSNLLRLNPDASPDPAFVQRATAGDIYDLALQPDGKLLLAGSLATPGSAYPLAVARLQPGGALDPSFQLGSGIGDNNKAWSIALQPDGRILVVGDFTTYNGVPRNRVARLHTDGSVDAGFNTGAGADNVVVHLALQADGKVLVQGFFSTYDGQPRHHVARLHADGSVDAGFVPGSGTNGMLHDVAPGADGRALVAGRFTIGGIDHARLLRLNADGGRDAAFNPGFVSLPVEQTAVQPDGKVLTEGGFTSQLVRFNADGSFDTAYHPAVRDEVGFLRPLADGRLLLAGGFRGAGIPSGITRLQPDGSRDAAFNPAVPAGINVFALDLGPDGRILLFGGDGAVNSFYRLNADGSAAAPFAPALPADFLLQHLAVAADGKVLLLGDSGSVDRAPYLGRFTAGGGADAGFQPSLPAGFYPSGMAVQADGKVLLRGVLYPGSGSLLLRLNADGSADTAFNTRVASLPVTAMALQPDGRILVGTQQGFGATAPGGLLRLHPDGSGDGSFTTGTALGLNTGRIQSITPAGDRIVAGGLFSTYNGSPRVHLVRLLNDSPGGAGISYAGAPYCGSSGTVLPALTGTAGGSFSATPAGLSLDAGTGAIDLAASVAGTYTVTYTYGGGGTTATVSIRPASLVSNVSNRVLCAGASVPNTSFSGPPGITYSWTNSNPAIGLPASGTGGLPAFTAQTTGSSAETATITVQPAGGTGCVLKPVVFRITVNPAPTVQAVTSQALCAGGTTAAVTFTGGAPGTVYGWTNDNPSIGLGASGSGNIPSFVARNESGVPQSATIRVTPRLGGCSGAPQTFTIGVSPAAGAISYGQSSYCRTGRAFVRRTGSGGGSFSAAPAGLALDAQTGTVSLAASQPGTYTITYSVGATGGCSAAATTGLTVLPQATVNPVPNALFCLGSMSSPIGFSGTAASYSWTNDNPSIGLPASGTGGIPSFMPTATGIATIRVVPQGGGCTGKAIVFRIRVQSCSVTQAGDCSGDGGTLRGATIGVSPNPARQQVTVSYSGSPASVTATLLHPSGAPALRPVAFRGNTVTLHLGGLPSGQYVIQLTDTRTGESVQRQLLKF